MKELQKLVIDKIIKQLKLLNDSTAVGTGVLDSLNALLITVDNWLIAEANNKKRK